MEPLFYPKGDSIFVTGATGLLGAQFIRKLLGQGYRVVALRRKEVPDPWLKEVLSCVGSFCYGVFFCVVVFWQTSQRNSVICAQRRIPLVEALLLVQELGHHDTVAIEIEPLGRLANPIRHQKGGA